MYYYYNVLIISNCLCMPLCGLADTESPFIQEIPKQTIFGYAMLPLLTFSNIEAIRVDIIQCSRSSRFCLCFEPHINAMLHQKWLQNLIGFGAPAICK